MQNIYKEFRVLSSKLSKILELIFLENLARIFHIAI